MAQLVVLIAAGLFVWLRNGSFQPALLTPDEASAADAHPEQDDDKGLDGAVMQGLELELQQSRYLKVRGVESIVRDCIRLPPRGRAQTLL